MVYFKHSCNASTDLKLIKFMDSLGRDWAKGYFYFFTLLELFGNNSELNKNKTQFKFHLYTIRQLWRCTERNVMFLCEKLNESELMVCTISGNSVEFSAPNFMKYFGFENTEKRKVEKKREEEIIPSIPSVNIPSKTPENGINKKKETKIKYDFNDDRKSVILIRKDNKLSWNKNSGYNLVEDLHTLFPNIKKDLIRKECENVTSKLEKLPDQEFEKRGPFQFSYLVNILNNSKYNK